MNKKQLQARVEALESYVHMIDNNLGELERKVGEVSVIFASQPDAKTLEENEREMDAFIEKMNMLSSGFDDGEAPF